MNTFRLIAATFVFAALFAVSAFAQTAAPTGRVGLINTLAFDDAKAGITKYVTAMNSLDTEFKPENTNLQTMATKLQTLQNEIENLRKQAAASSAVPIKPETVNTKLEEYDKMSREFKFKQEDAKARFERRQQIIMGPVMQDIGKALQEFAKQKGYSVILDAAKLDNAGVILAFDDKADVTKEFIQFYNTRPAGTATASATTPK